MNILFCVTIVILNLVIIGLSRELDKLREELKEVRNMVYRLRWPKAKGDQHE